MNIEITELEFNKTFKYFGINHGNGINHIINKEKYENNSIKQ